MHENISLSINKDKATIILIPPSFFILIAFLSVTFNKLNQSHLLRMHKNLPVALLIYFLTKEGVKVCRMKFRVVSYIDRL